MLLETITHYYEKFCDEFISRFRAPRIRSFILLFLSAVLLILSFPQTNYWLLAWIALTPFFLCLEGKIGKQAFLCGYVCGLIFFAGTLYWFIHVTVLGAALLIAYLAVYFGLFALGHVYFSHLPLPQRLVFLPSLWVALEYLRGHLMSGFGWASLCHSQYKNLWMIQIADVTGMLGVSFLIILVNVFIYECVRTKWDVGQVNVAHIKTGAAVVICVLVTTMVYGLTSVKTIREAKPLGVSVVQGNIRQEFKWDHRLWPAILKKYISLTKETSEGHPSLIIWPETAFPGILGNPESAELFEYFRSSANERGVPILFGVVTKEDDSYYNSAVMMNASADGIKRYDKLHLVPFGEFIPFRGYFPLLTDIIPIDDFSPGKDVTVFSLPMYMQDGSILNGLFSVMICFEDSVAHIARDFVKQGAQFLVNITNDAWFKESKAPFMHVQSSVFRAVENRRYVIRSANTGVSCIIDHLGKVRSYLQNTDKKRTFIAGQMTGIVELYEEMTFYTKFGDIFTYLCFGCILWGMLTNISIIGLFRNKTSKEDQH